MCGFFDVVCYAQSWLWDTWSNVSFFNKLLIVCGIVGLITALCWSFLLVLKKIGGWPAVGAAVAVILGVVLALLPRKPKGRDDGPYDRAGLPRRDTAVPKPRKGKRRFDAPSGKWQRLDEKTGRWLDE